MVPRTHRLPHGPWETLGRSFQSTMTLDADLHEELIPNCFKFASPAGWASTFFFPFFLASQQIVQVGAGV